MIPENVTQLIERLKTVEQIEAIALAGSRTTQESDELSDYDFYVYWREPLTADAREALIGDLYSYVEIDNQYWEIEDDGFLKDGTEVELIYRDFHWLESTLENTLHKHQANIGFTTCFWFNLLNSRIIYDPNGNLNRIRSRFTIPYPTGLKQAIIDKNLPLLLNAMPAFPKQIEKALARGDHFSAHHRITAYLNSYFDVLYALNELPMPGEKRLLHYAEKQCKALPDGFRGSLNKITHYGSLCDSAVLEEVHKASNNLRALVEKSS